MWGTGNEKMPAGRTLSVSDHCVYDLYVLEKKLIRLCYLRILECYGSVPGLSELHI